MKALAERVAATTLRLNMTFGESDPKLLRRRLSLAASAVLSLVVAASCGGTTVGSDGAPGGSAGAGGGTTAGSDGAPGGSAGAGAVSAAVPIDQFPSLFADAWCDNVGSCCSAGNWSFDLATCKLNAAQTMGTSLIAVTSPYASYDANAAGACLQAVASFVRGCNARSNPGVDAPCSALVVGTLPQGSACTSNQDCAPDASKAIVCWGLTFSDHVTSGTGVCEVAPVSPIPHGKAGDQCVDTCQGSAQNPECIIAASTLPNAVPCFMSDGLYCPSPGLTCQPLLQVGQKCTLHSCVVGAFCDVDTCAPQRDTGPCQVGDDSCSPKSFCNAGQCELKRPDGSACQSGDWCQANQCVPPEVSTSDNSGTCSTDSLANGKACSGTLE